MTNASPTKDETPVTAPRNTGPLPAITQPSSNSDKTYLIFFPQFLTTLFEPLDLYYLHLFQHPTVLQHPLSYPIAFILTTLTAIETPLALPCILYALDYPKSGDVVTACLLTLGIVTQLPKKLLWRPRPWMVGKAHALRKDRTSSFPSRAVVCAVVFPVMIGVGGSIEHNGRKGMGVGLWDVLSVVLLVGTTSWARVFVGAHYPSDCVVGAFVGVFICWVALEYTVNVWDCLGCGTMMMGDARWEGLVRVTKESFWSTLPIGRLLIAALVAYALTLVSLRGFWVKCSYVYGLLFAAATFRYVWLCGTNAQGQLLVALPKATDLSRWRQLIWLITGFGVFLAFGMIMRKKKAFKVKVAVFSIIYWGALSLILYWRLVVTASASTLST